MWERKSWSSICGHPSTYVKILSMHMCVYVCVCVIVIYVRGGLVGRDYTINRNEICTSSSRFCVSSKRCGIFFLIRWSQYKTLHLDPMPKLLEMTRVQSGTLFSHRCYAVMDAKGRSMLRTSEEDYRWELTRVSAHYRELPSAGFTQTKHGE